MDISYPSYCEVFNLAQTAGIHFITKQACTKVAETMKEIIDEIAHRMVVLHKNLEIEEFNIDHINSLIDRYVTRDNYTCSEYVNESKYPSDHVTNQYRENSTKLLTPRARFLGALRHAIYVTSTFGYNTSELEKIKIDINLASALQKYVENKIVVILYGKVFRVYGNVFYSKYFNVDKQVIKEKHTTSITLSRSTSSET